MFLSLKTTALSSLSRGGAASPESGPDLDCSPPKRPTAPQAEEEEAEVDPEVIPETPNKEVREERVLVAPPTKKRKTRQTLKEENVSITAPMIEVSGPDGPMMVFRPWTVNDIKEAMAHLPSPALLPSP